MKKVLFILILPSLALAEGGRAKQISDFAKGVLAERKGDNEKAVEFYRGVRKEDSDSFFLARKESGTQSSLGDMEGAVQTMREFAERYRENLAAQFSYVDFLKQVSGRDENARKLAVETMEEAWENHGLNEGVFNELLSGYEAEEAREKSLGLFDDFKAKEGDEASYWLTRLRAAGVLMDGSSEAFQEEKGRCYDGLRQMGLEDDFIARKVSEYYRQQGDLEEAIAVLSEHVEKVPSSTSLMTRMGILQMAKGDVEAGKRTFIDVIAINPREALAHASLAKHYEKEGQKSLALELRSESLKISGGTPMEFLNLANQYLEYGDAHPARLLLEKARFDHPEEVEILAKLSVATVRDGMVREAGRLFRQVESLVEDLPVEDQEEAAQYLDADFQLEFAQILLDSGDGDLAEERLRKAIRSIGADQPKKSARALCALAKVWIESGKNEAAAMSLLKRSRIQDPTNEEVEDLIERLSEK